MGPVLPSKRRAHLLIHRNRVAMILPTASAPDLKIFAGLTSQQLWSLSEILRADSGSTEQDMVSISVELKVSPEEARSIYTIARYCIRQSNDYSPEEIHDSMVDLLVEKGNESGVLALRENASAIRNLFSVCRTPRRTREEKVQFLLYSSQKTVDSVRSICEIRPVFLETNGEERIDGHVSLVRLFFEQSDLEGNREVTSIAFTPSGLKSLEDCIERTWKKLIMIDEKYSEGEEVDAN